MSNLRRRVARHDEDSFVGRTAELQLLEQMLGRSVPQQVVHVVGPGGMGKTTLLRQMARSAAALGYEVVWVDGRDVPPTAGGLEPLLGQISTERPTLVVFDSYELMSSLDLHLREEQIPELPDTTIVAFGSRRPPAAGWFEAGWAAVVAMVELGPLAAEDASTLARLHGVSTERVPELVRQSRGSPLALVVGASTGSNGSLAFLAGRLLGAEADVDHQRALAVAALARVTTPELLAAVLPEHDARESYRWLSERSFVDRLADGVALHALVADSVRDALRRDDPMGEALLRRRIADHLYERARAGSFALSADLQHLVVDRSVRWGYSADVGSRYRIDTVRPGDVERIAAIHRAIGFEEWWQAGLPFFVDEPGCTRIARDGNGEIGGYCVAMGPATAPDIAAHDLVLGPWLRYAREQLRSTSVVIWREAVDLTGSRGEVTALLGAAGLLGSGVSNPRYIILPISPVIPEAQAFSESLGGRAVPELTVEAHGMTLECHVVDLGPGGMLGFQREWIYRETGTVPPSDVAADDPAQLLAQLRSNSGLVDGPSWLGPNRSARTERLRALVADVVAGFGPGTDDVLAREIITAAYLDELIPHEGVARRLHISRSAYFRRLRSASDRVADELRRHPDWGH